MTISLKTTVIFSGTLALLLNVWHFASTYQARQDAFAPSWATASLSSKPAPTPIPTDSPAKVQTASVTTSTPPPLSQTPPTPAVQTQAQTVPAPPVTMDQQLVAQTLSSHGLNPVFASLYLESQADTGTPWELIAAVHKVETNQAGNTDRTSSAGATGPMQFLPATFDSYAMPGYPDVTSVQDAILAAGRYLAANGAARGDYSDAVYHYNHSWDYVDRVLAIADNLGL
jgi:hypothetical protein